MKTQNNQDGGPCFTSFHFHSLVEDNNIHANSFPNAILTMFHSNQPVQCTEWDISFTFFISFNFQISILFLFKYFHCVVLVKRQFYIVINWKYCGLHYDLKRSLWGTVTQDNWRGHSSSCWGQKVKTDISHMTKRLKEMKVKSLKITIISLISCLLKAWTWGDKR